MLLRLAEAACIVGGAAYLLYAVTLYVTYRLHKKRRTDDRHRPI